jgi:hypothetical protein
MPKITDSPKRSCPISIDDIDYQYIQRVGVGKNFSEKVRSIIKRAQGQYDVLATYENGVLCYKLPGAICAYMENADGEKIWEPLPFEYNKKKGWKGLQSVAQAAGYIAQVIEDEAYSLVAVWITKAHHNPNKNCTDCQKKIMEVLCT